MKKKQNFDHEIVADIDDGTEPEFERPEIDFDSLRLESTGVVPTEPMDQFFTERFHEGLLMNRAAREETRLQRIARGRARAEKRGPTPESETVRLARVVTGQNFRAEETGAHGVLNRDEWTRWRDAFDGACAYCGKPTRGAECIEHVAPIARGGENTIYNVVPACWSCNHGKGPKDPVDWMRRTGRLQGFVARVSAAIARLESEGPAMT